MVQPVPGKTQADRALHARGQPEQARALLVREPLVRRARERVAHHEA